MPVEVDLRDELRLARLPLRSLTASSPTGWLLRSARLSDLVDTVTRSNQIVGLSLLAGHQPSFAVPPEIVSPGPGTSLTQCEQSTSGLKIQNLV